MFDALLDETTVTRDGVAVGRGSDIMRLWKLVLLIAAHDGARAVHVSRQGETATLSMDEEVTGRRYHFGPPPGRPVDDFCTLLTATEPWYRRLARRFRAEPRPLVPSGWQGRIEVRGLVLPVECDVLPHPGGVLIWLGFAVTAEEVARIGFPAAEE